MRNRLYATLVIACASGVFAAEPIDIGIRRELFVDEFLVENMDAARLQLHHPVSREVAVVHDTDWEGNTSGYHTVFQDGDLYRMYYRGSHHQRNTERADHPQFACYAESKDGIHWVKPVLELFEFNGSKANNIVWAGSGTHNFAPFKDANPDCPPEAQYRAVGGIKGGLATFASADGIHWRQTSENPVITEGAFDSQNLAFWDTRTNCYRDFHRHFAKGVRAIMTCTSEDFANWTDPVWLEYAEGTPNEHLYTNQITQYPRAPHIYMGFPKRFQPSRHAAGNLMPGLSDGVFMTSRDGLVFHRWLESWIRPGPQRERWVNRNNMTAWGIVETRSAIPGTPNELSVYSTEGYYQGESCQIRRYSLRLDGFVSLTAPMSGGEIVTKPLVFAAPKAPRPEPEGIATANTKTKDGRLHVIEPIAFPIPGTKEIGTAFTLAVSVSNVPNGHRRLFSVYDGGGPVKKGNGEMMLDLWAGGGFNTGVCLRFGFDDESINVCAEDIPGWADMLDGDTPAHFAATWDDGVSILYMNGKEVGRIGEPGHGPGEFSHGDIRFGEDYPPTSTVNEPFLGFADDILVLRRAMSPEEVARLAADGAKAVVKPDEDGVLYSMDGPDAATLADQLPSDGTSDAKLTAPRGVAWGEAMLLLNVATSAAGSVRCELQTADGDPIPGFTIEEADIIYGDEIERIVSWGRGRSELKQFAGQPIRLRVELKDADIYALRFGQPQVPISETCE